MMNLTLALIVLIFGGLISAFLAVAVLSRHKKAATGQLKLMDSVAVVETTLQPEGSVLIRGELWRARSRAGLKVERGARVYVVGASGHLLEVEPASRVLPSTNETKIVASARSASDVNGY